jgi:LmbE family N-acetylglucosaminyl deacetylase
MKIIFISAHYDDETLSAGGTIAKFCQEGQEVFCYIMSLSDYTNYNGDILRNNSEAEKEGIKGLKILGIKESNIKNFGFKTKEVPFSVKSIEKINHTIDSINPDLIITHHLSSSHQDHINTAKSVMAASRNQKNIWMFEPTYPDKMHNIPFHPIIYIDISKFMNLKIKSLKKHQSQWKKYSYWNDLVLSLGRLRGIENKCLFSECFEPIKMEYII